MFIWKFCSYLTLAVFALITVQYICILNELDYKPSQVFEKLAEWAKIIFENIGYYLGCLSYFAKYLKFEKFLEAIIDILKPIIQIIFAFTHTAKGYFEYVNLHGSSIVFGTFIILAIITYFIHQHRVIVWQKAKPFLDYVWLGDRDRLFFVSSIIILVALFVRGE